MARSKGRLDLETLLGEEEMWTMEQKKRSGLRNGSWQATAVVVSFSFPCYRSLVLMATSFRHALPMRLHLLRLHLRFLEWAEPVQVIIPRNILEGQSAQVPEEEGMIHSQDQVLKVCSQKPRSAVASNSQTAELGLKRHSGSRSLFKSKFYNLLAVLSWANHFTNSFELKPIHFNSKMGIIVISTPYSYCENNNSHYYYYYYY